MTTTNAKDLTGTPADDSAPGHATPPIRCVHRWKIPAAPAAAVGVCTHCGDRRSFSNAAPPSAWEERAVASWEAATARTLRGAVSR